MKKIILLLALCLVTLPAYAEEEPYQEASITLKVNKQFVSAGETMIFEAQLPKRKFEGVLLVEDTGFTIKPTEITRDGVYRWVVTVPSKASGSKTFKVAALEMMKEASGDTKGAAIIIESNPQEITVRKAQ